MIDTQPIKDALDTLVALTARLAARPGEKPAWDAQEQCTKKAREYCLQAYAKLFYSDDVVHRAGDDLERFASERFLGVAVVSEEQAELIRQINDEKRCFETLIAPWRSQYIKTQSQTTGAIVSESLARHIVRELGYPRLHFLQTTRLISLVDTPLKAIRVSHRVSETVERVKVIDVEQYLAKHQPLDFEEKGLLLDLACADRLVKKRGPYFQTKARCVPIDREHPAFTVSAVLPVAITEQAYTAATRVSVMAEQRVPRPRATNRTGRVIAKTPVLPNTPFFEAANA